MLEKSISVNIVYSISPMNLFLLKHMEDCMVLNGCQAIGMPAEG